jgi:hypothetical protein
MSITVIQAAKGGDPDDDGAARRAEVDATVIQRHMS